MLVATHTLTNGGWGGGRGGGGEAGVNLPTHFRTKAPYEADMTPEFPTENFSSHTNVSKSVTNAS